MKRTPLKRNKPLNPIGKRKKRELPIWNQVKEHVFKRDGYKCQHPLCQTFGMQIDPHHFLKQNRYPEYKFELWNIITLCRFCHTKVESDKRYEYVLVISLPEIHELLKKHLKCLQLFDDNGID